MRARRRSKRQVTSQTYSFNLDPSEVAVTPTEYLKNVKVGSELMFKCTMAKEMEHGGLRYHDKEIGEYSGNSTAIFRIPSYTRNHAGIYECTGKRPDGKWQLRSVRVISERGNTTHLPTCTDPKHVDTCGDNGRCVFYDGMNFCECDDGYMGQFCEQLYISSFDGRRAEISARDPPIKVLQVVGGTFTMLNIVCVVIAIILLMLYLREKQKKRRVRQKFDEFCKAIEDCDKEYEEELIRENEHKLSKGSFARQSMKKMRLAYQRARLDELTDPKLIDNPS